MEDEFDVSHTVSILAISLFVEGLGIGPLFVGPLSEVYGRNPIYRASFGLLFAFSWGVAFAPNIGTLRLHLPESFLTVSYSRLLDIPLPDGTIWCSLPQRSRRHRERLVSTQQSSQVRVTHRQSVISINHHVVRWLSILCHRS